MTIETDTNETREKIIEGLKNDQNAPVDETVDSSESDNPAPEDNKPKVSDNEAKLLKEVMKHKEAARKAAAEAKELKEKFDGIDLDAIKVMLDKQEADETAALEKKGEYDRLLAKQREAADAKVAAEKERADKAEADRLALSRQIEDLTTGQAFSNSKFVTDKLTLTPNKAKALYKDHFEYVDGAMVAYDKPKGASDRTPIVDDAGNGVSFDDAMAAIINADPDKDYLLKAEQKSGSGSKPSAPAKPKEKEYGDTTDKIAAGLGDLFKNIGKK